MDKMTSTNSNEFDQEPNLWKVKLERRKQENVLLKYRLSEMVDSSESIQFLQVAEYFQNELLLMDDKLKNLLLQLEEVSSFSRHFKKAKELPVNVATGYNKLKRDISDFENRFEDLSNEFNKKMSENTGA